MSRPVGGQQKPLDRPCTRCSIAPPEAKFGVDGKGRRKSQCRKCESKLSIVSHNRTPEKIKERNREWNRKHRIEQTEKYREENKRKHYERCYKLTLDELEQIWVTQGCVCDICKCELPNPARTNATGQVNMDHDHKTGTNRGILCYKCNTGLGNFNDNTAFLAAAIIYLEKFS